MENMVSVILTTYNRHSLLPRALQSVIDQTYENWECIVVDDASDEPVQPILEAYDNSRVRYHRHDKNKGLSAARNTGLRLARGSMVAFLDDDDEWLPEKLDRQVEQLEQADDAVGLVYCWMESVRNGAVFKYKRPSFRGDIFEHTLDRQPLGNGSTWLLRRDAVLDHEGFDEALPRGIDGDLLRRLCVTHKVDYVPQVLVRYHVEHNHQRITRSDTDGIRNAIIGQKAKLSKFEHELAKLPRQRSRIHARIAYRYGQLHEWSNCLDHLQHAFRSDPFSGYTYYNALKLLVNSI